VGVENGLRTSTRHTDVTVKPLYGHQEGAVKGYNPHQPGRPSHTDRSYFLSGLRSVRDVEVQAGNQRASPYGSSGLWELLGRLAAAGRIRSVVTRVGGSEDVPTVQRAMEGGHNRGKIVARFAPDP